MKYSAAILLALFGLTAASFLHQQEDVFGNKEEQFRRINNRNRMDDNFDNTDKISHNTDRMFLEKQKIVLQLLSNLKQDTTTHEHLIRLGSNFNPIRNMERFHNNEQIVKFLKMVENNNFLPKDEVFSPINQQHQNQAAQLFAFMYNAQDWETLKEAAAWARNNFNTEQFAYTFAAVVMNHHSTQGVILPALYEIIPHAFVPATTLEKIYKAKLEGHKKVTVKATYTNQNKNNNNYNKMDNLNNMNNMDNMENMNRRRMDNNDNDNTMWGPNNANNVFADNDGSLNNNAGVTENPETKMSYFTEDIGINDLHARFHILNPAFLGVNKNKNFYTSNMDTTNKQNTIDVNKHDLKRGEAFYFAHQQLFARYVLERLSNNLPIPHPINLDDKIETGYNPNLKHINGQAVPARPPMTKFLQHQVDSTNNDNNVMMPNNNQAQKPQVYEQRLQQVAESGLVMNQDGSKTKLNKINGVGILANLIAAPASSLNPDYYGDYFSAAKNAIGNIVDPNNQNKVASGAISNYATAARDPAYYQLLAKFNQIMNNLQNKQGPYTKSELNMSGVKIQKVDVSNLETRFETFNVNVNNAVPKKIRNMNLNSDNLDNNNMNFDNDEELIVKFQRLTNKPFEIKMNVLSDKTRDAIVRVFIGPKYDSNGQRFTLPQASRFFVQLDQFKVKLHNGENEIERNSQESNVNAYNPLSIKQLWNRAEQGQLEIKQGDHQVLGLLKHAQLPKGKQNGQQFVMYIIVNDIENMNDNMNNEEASEMDMDNTMNGRTNINDKVLRHVRDHRSIGFPLDRPVVDVNFNTANQYFKTVTIHHNVNNDN